MELNDLIKGFEAKIDALKTESVSKNDLENLKSEMETIKSQMTNAETINGLTAKMDELALQIAEKSTVETNSPFAELEQVLIEKGDAIKNQKTQGNIANVTIKAVGPVLTTNVTAGAGGNVVAMTQSTGELYATADNRLFAESIMNSMRVDLDTITYIDEVNGEGGAGMTSEGGTKSQGDVDYVERTVALQNVTHFIKVSTKMLRQPSYIVDAVRSKLLRKLQLKKQEQLLSGDGTAPDITGIKGWATTYDGTDFNGSVIEPNLNDLIRVCVALISKEGDDFVPNYVIVSHKRMADMDLKKATDGHYVLPPFSSLDNRVVAGVRVIASNEFTDAELLVGDFTKANYVYNSDIQLSINLDGNDFTKNLRTILAEQAIALYVSNNETGAFVLVDDIDQALTDLATA